MSGDDSENQGLFEAHPPAENSAIAADPERAAKIGSTRATVEASMSDLQQQLMPQQAEPEQQSLLLDEADEACLFKGPVRHVAETIANHRRGRGRPPGSQNKASREFAETLLRMGFKHPGIALAELASADPVQLADELTRKLKDETTGTTSFQECTPLDALQLILKANAELLPYFQSKAAQKVELNKTVQGVMLIGDMKTEGPVATAIMDLTRFDEPQ